MSSAYKLASLLAQPLNGIHYTSLYCKTGFKYINVPGYTHFFINSCNLHILCIDSLMLMVSYIPTCVVIAMLL